MVIHGLGQLRRHIILPCAFSEPVAHSLQVLLLEFGLDPDLTRSQRQARLLLRILKSLVLSFRGPSLSNQLGATLQADRRLRLTSTSGSALSSSVTLLLDGRGRFGFVDAGDALKEELFEFLVVDEDSIS